MADPYTADDVEALAERLAAAVDSTVFEPPNADQDELAPFRDEYRTQARAALTWLADRLLPAGGEAREQWGVRWPDGHVKDDFTGRAAAEVYVHIATRDLVRRTVTTWPDGTTLTGPWTPAGEASDG